MKKQTGLITQLWVLYVLALALLLGIGLAGCSPPSAPKTTPEGPEITVSPGDTVAIQVSAGGADRYQWTHQGVGEISATDGPAILYTAPEEAGGKALLIVTAHNDRGASPPTSLTINIAGAVTVQLDALAIPAGWMSGRSDPEPFIRMETSSDCHTGANCSQFTYRSGGSWGGIYWWPLICGESGTPDAWNKVRNGTCGVNLLETGNFSAMSRLTFWARGDQGNEVVEFKIGGADVSPAPGRSLGKVALEPTWNQYEIDLEGLDPTNVIGLFCWVATDVDNPQGAVFYLDDVQFEGVK